MHIGNVYLTVFTFFSYFIMDYRKVKKLLYTFSQTTQQTTNYDLNIKTGDNTTYGLKIFAKYKVGEWPHFVYKNLILWKVKKSDLLQEITSFSQKLFDRSLPNQITKFNKIHFLKKNVEIIWLGDRSELKDDYTILVIDNYAVRKRDAIIKRVV